MIILQSSPSIIVMNLYLLSIQKAPFIIVRANPVALHLRFFIHDADADAGSKPNGPYKPDFRMKSLAITTTDLA